MIFANGSLYVGNWLADQFDGKGRFIDLDRKQVYEGKFKRGQKEGQGRITQLSGTSYDGEWKNDKRHGRGVFKFTDGEEYDGGW